MRPMPSSHFSHRLRRWLPWGLKVLLSLLLLVYLFRLINVHRFVSDIANATLWPIAISLAVYVPAQMLDTYRWLFVLRKFDPSATFRALWRPNMAGQFFGQFLPGDVSSDIVRLLAAAPRHQKKTALVLSVVVEKFAMLVVVGAVALLGVWFSHSAMRDRSLELFLMFVIISAAIFFFVLCRYRGKWLSAIANRLPIPGKIRDIIHSISAVSALSFGAGFLVILQGTLQQLIMGVASYLIARGMHISIPLVDWIGIHAIVSIVRNVPVSIGGLGVREGLFALFLRLYGVPIELSTACSLISFFLTTLMAMFVWVGSEGISFFLHMKKDHTSTLVHPS